MTVVAPSHPPSPPARFEIERRTMPFSGETEKKTFGSRDGRDVFLPPQLWKTHVWYIGVFSPPSRNNFWGNGEAWPVLYRCSNNTGKNIEFRRWGRQIYARTKMQPPLAATWPRVCMCGWTNKSFFESPDTDPIQTNAIQRRSWKQEDKDLNRACVVFKKRENHKRARFAKFVW